MNTQSKDLVDKPSRIDKKMWGFFLGSFVVFSVSALVSIGASLAGLWIAGVLFTLSILFFILWPIKQDAWDKFPDLNRSIILSLLFFGIQWLSVYCLTMGLSIQSNSSDWIKIFALLMAFYIFSAAFYIKFGMHARSFLHFKCPSKPMVIYGIIVGLCLGVISTMTYVLLSRLSSLEPRLMLPTVHPSSIIYLFIIFPIVTEIFYRGVILNGLLRHFDVTFAIVLNAIMACVFAGTPLYIPFVFLSAACFGVLFIRSKSIWPAIIARAIITITPIIILNLI